MILLKDIQSVHLVSWFPGVVTFGVALPLYEILECSGTSMMSVVPNLFHLILFFIINQVRWGLGVVWAMGICFNIWGKKRHVKDWVNCP